MITSIDKHTALVIIDLQKGIIGMPVVHSIQDILDKSALLADAFRKAGLPVVPVNVIPSGASLHTRKDNAAQSMAASLAADFAELVSEIKAQPGDIFITKQTWNAFFNTPLHGELQKRHVTGIVLCGVSTSSGVEGTARAAAELGYNVSFASDAMTDRLLDAHNNSQKIIFPRIGELGTTAEIIAKLNSRV